MIVSDDNLLGILKKASLKTPGSLFPAVPEYLAMYRDIIKVVSRSATLSGLYSFYLTIPLQGDKADIFDIFRIDSLPYALPNSPYFVQNQSTKNIYSI